MASLFWGVSISESTQATVEVPQDRGLIVTRAALAGSKQGANVLKLKSTAEFVLGTLRYEGVEQFEMDLIVAAGSSVTFSMTGSNQIHISGYYNLAYGDEDDSIEQYSDYSDEPFDAIDLEGYSSGEDSFDSDEFDEISSGDDSDDTSPVVEQLSSDDEEAVPKAPVAAIEAPKRKAKAAQKPAETKPAETKPAETKPAETKPAETKPAETKQESAKPAKKKKGKKQNTDQPAPPTETGPTETKQPLKRPNPTPEEEVPQNQKKQKTQAPTQPATEGQFTCEPCKRSFKTIVAFNQHNQSKHAAPK